jgi:hypothetical protein
MATTSAPGLGAYTSLSDPGAGITSPALGADGAAEDEADGNPGDVLGDGVAPHEASRIAETSSETASRSERTVTSSRSRNHGHGTLSPDARTD